ncbi:MAG: DNA polymerase III subunit epsilon [Methylophilaceae bacterium]
MRQVFLDTETTGLDPAQGHRIIEIAAVEVVNRRLTGNRFHQYLNPDREIDFGAQQVHGISLEDLQDKPRFREIAAEFLAFIHDAELVIHNAPFDLGFLNNELGLVDLGKIAHPVIDTLKMAKDLHPGQRNNLDALCKRYGVDNSGRTLHGALLDTELLADVYMAMTRGQDSLMMELSAQESKVQEASFKREKPLVVLSANEEDLSAHDQYLTGLDKASGGSVLWKKLQESNV